MKPIFITGIGTGVGKTLIAAMVTEALGAYYWKPVQAGFDEGTDAGWVGSRISPTATDPDGRPLTGSRILPEAYKLKLPASPHIAAREEGVVISLDDLAAEACFSPFHFSRVFRDTTGLSPHRYVMGRRVQLAQNMLAANRLSLAQIALQCGFSNQQHMTRMVRRLAGRTPGSIRRDR